jgi:hypothetical protein
MRDIDMLDEKLRKMSVRLPDGDRAAQLPEVFMTNYEFQK